MLNVNAYWDKHENAIRDYCAKHRLSYGKLCASPCCYDDEELIILYHNPQKGHRGLLDDNEPMPSTLEIFLEDGKLRFEQTDITHKYLGVEKDVAPTPKVTRTVRSSIPSRQKLAYA